MSTPPAWLTLHAEAAAQHPAARRQHARTQRFGHTPAYTASRSGGAALFEPGATPRVHSASPGPVATMPTQADLEPHSATVYPAGPDLHGRAEAHHLDRVDDRYPIGVDELAFGAPGLAEAMVHQETSARESAEHKLDEERARCELLQHEIERLQAQLTGASLTWKCPICCAIFPRAEKDEHGKRCLTQFVEFVQSGSPATAGGR